MAWFQSPDDFFAKSTSKIHFRQVVPDMFGTSNLPAVLIIPESCIEDPLLLKRVFAGNGAKQQLISMITLSLANQNDLHDSNDNNELLDNHSN